MKLYFTNGKGKVISVNCNPASEYGLMSLEQLKCELKEAEREEDYLSCAKIKAEIDSRESEAQ